MSRSIPTQTPAGTPPVIAAPADGGDNLDTAVSALRAEVAALRQRLEERQENPPREPPKRQAKPRTPRKTVAWLTTGAALAMLAGASVVYGETDAFSISKEGDVAIGPSGGLFIGKAGNVAIGLSRFVSSGYKLLVSTPEPKTKESTSQAAGLAVTTNETDYPFGLGIRLKGAPTLADRSAVLVTTDVNQAEGGRLVLQPTNGNVGIGTYTPNAGNKLEVNGKIATQSLSTLDQSVKIEGGGGRNLFSDSEKAGNLRVGGVSNTPGIYSDKGDVIVASQSNNVWLRGKVAISTEADAQKRNQPETLYVDGRLKATGTVDGNMKVVYQRDDDTQTTYSKPLWRYHMSLTAAKFGGSTKTIPNEILEKLCGTRDGCEVRLGMTRWDNNSQTQTASRTAHFYYSINDKHWRSEWEDREGVIGGGSAQTALVAWYCEFTEKTWENGQDKGNRGTGMQLRVMRDKKSAATCELTLIP